MRFRTVISISLFLLLSLSSISIKAIDPPQGLKWEMTFDEVKGVLSQTKELGIKELSQKGLPKGFKSYSDLRIPDGYSRSELKGAKLLEKKVKRSYLVFDEANKLSSFQYFLLFDQGRGQCWSYHADFKHLLEQKYGKPILDETDEHIRQRDIADGVKYSVIWEDSSGCQINLIISNQSLGSDFYLIFLIYSVNGYAGLLDEKRSKNDDF